MMPNSLRVSRVIDADAETLFRAWTDPGELMHWWRMQAEGWAFAGASIDLRVGGHYSLSMTDPAGNMHVAVGEYREVQRPVRLVFTWDWENAANRVGETLVTVEFNTLAKRRTEVVLIHEGFASAARRQRHEEGWAELMELLEAATNRQTYQKE
jgi:uncharacterized protein YndB with AHSA1/START domain